LRGFIVHNEDSVLIFACHYKIPFFPEAAKGQEKRPEKAQSICEQVFSAPG